MTTQRTRQRANRIANTVLLVITLLLAAMTAYIVFQPIDPVELRVDHGDRLGHVLRDDS